MTTSLRTLSVAALLGTSVLGLTACGGSDKASDTATSTSAATTTATTSAVATESSSTPAATESSNSPAAGESSAMPASSAPATATSSAPATTASAPAATASAAPVPAGYKAAPGKGYSFAVPQDWKATQIPGNDIGYMATKPTSGFMRNVAVTAKDAKGMTNVATAKGEARSALQKVGTQVKELPDTTIGGEKAIGFSTALTMGQIKARNVQYFTLHQGKAYVVTYTGPQSMTAEQLARQAAPIVSSWKWTA